MKSAIILVLAASAGVAHADRVPVRVVEVAGGLAYLDVGRAAGVVRGTSVKFQRVTLSVVETTEKTCAVELGNATLAIGATGIAEVTPGATAAVKKLASPRPASAFVEQWPDLVVPAETQAPRPVPLGSGKRAGQAHVAVIGRGYAAIGRDSRAAQAEARVIATYDLLPDAPLSADVDVAGRVFSAGANRDERVPVFVRTAQLRYGDLYDPRVALGRLRYAAASLGMLDGARAGLRAGRIELAAFGGLIPDPINGKPDTSASRFGAEVGYAAEDAAWRPRVELTAYGSTWNGTLDERRLTLNASATGDALHFDGWAEAQQFAADNPWGARAIEVTGAGSTVQWRQRGMHIGSDVTFLRPERSLRLADRLPAEWLGNPGDHWVSGSAFAGVRRDSWSLDAIGAIGRTNGITVAYDTSGYLAGEIRSGPRRLLAGVSGGRASFARWVAGHIGAGMAVSRTLDVAIRYRPELLDYVASTGPVLQHAAVLDAHVRVGPTLDVVVAASGTVGADRDAAAVLTTLAWRPLP